MTLAASPISQGNMKQNVLSIPEGGQIFMGAIMQLPAGLAGVVKRDPAAVH